MDVDEYSPVLRTNNTIIFDVGPRARSRNMMEAIDKLRQDLKILEAMVVEMDDYLRSQAMFWPLADSSLPRLTLGGYLMRQHRLSALDQLLDDDERDRFNVVVENFNDALVEKVVRFEQHAHDELHARLRQWSEYLRELSHESIAAGDYYGSAVETRAMIAALLDKLEMPPYELDKRVLNELGAYDGALANHWIANGFIWPKEWRSAYPRSSYWWLYGRPRTTSEV